MHRLLTLALLHRSQLLLVAIADGSGRRASLLQLKLPVHILHAFLLVHQGHVLVSHHLSLVLFDLLLLIRDLVGAPVVLLDKLFVILNFVLALLALIVVPLVYQLLGCLPKHSLLLPVVLELLLVVHAFLS